MEEENFFTTLSFNELVNIAKEDHVLIDNVDLREIKQNDANTMIRVGQYYYHSKITLSGAKAMAWFKKAQMLRHLEAPYWIGQTYLDGNGFIHSTLQPALYWFFRGALNHEKQSEFRIGELYERGVYLKKNIYYALYWYKKSACQGYDEALSKVDSLAKETIQATDHGYLETSIAAASCCYLSSGRGNESRTLADIITNITQMNTTEHHSTFKPINASPCSTTTSANSGVCETCTAATNIFGLNGGSSGQCKIKMLSNMISSIHPMKTTENLHASTKDIGERPRSILKPALSCSAQTFKPIFKHINVNSSSKETEKKRSVTFDIPQKRLNQRKKGRRHGKKKSDAKQDQRYLKLMRRQIKNQQKQKRIHNQQKQRKESYDTEKVYKNTSPQNKIVPSIKPALYPKVRLEAFTKVKLETCPEVKFESCPEAKPVPCSKIKPDLCPKVKLESFF